MICTVYVLAGVITRKGEENETVEGVEKKTYIFHVYWICLMSMAGSNSSRN
jgi:hypothetical protein